MTGRRQKGTQSPDEAVGAELAAIGLNLAGVRNLAYTAPSIVPPVTPGRTTSKRLLRQLAFMDGSPVDIGDGDAQPRDLVGDDTDINLTVALLLNELPTRTPEDSNNLGCALLWSERHDWTVVQKLFDSAADSWKPGSTKRAVVERNRRILQGLRGVSAPTEAMVATL